MAPTNSDAHAQVTSDTRARPLVISLAQNLLSHAKWPKAVASACSLPVVLSPAEWARSTARAAASPFA
eukprot:5126000-Pyramimonas_sp.AAC.1